MEDIRFAKLSGVFFANDILHANKQEATPRQKEEDVDKGFQEIFEKEKKKLKEGDLYL